MTTRAKALTPEQQKMVDDCLKPALAGLSAVQEALAKSRGGGKA